MAFADIRYHIHFRSEENDLLTTSSFSIKKNALKEYERLQSMTSEQIAEELGLNSDLQVSFIEFYDYGRKDLDWFFVRSYDLEKGEEYIAKTKSI